MKRDEEREEEIGKDRKKECESPPLVFNLCIALDTGIF